MKPVVTIVFPTLNEEAVLGKTLEDAIRWLSAYPEYHPYEVLVIDNASTDNTPKIVQAISQKHGQVRLIRHATNLGYAASNLTAFREAQGEIVAVLDGDGQLTLEDLPAMHTQLKSGKKVVFGWRQHRNDPFLRIVISYFLNFVSKILLAWPFHDINCGYRVVTLEVAKAIRTAYPVNFFGPELWAHAVLQHWPVSEVIVKHFAREGGQSIHAFWKLPQAIGKALAYLMTLRSDIKSKESQHAKSAIKAA